MDDHAETEIKAPAGEFSPHGNDLFGEVNEGKHASDLGERFLLPPFSVLNAREGWWQDRKRAWIAQGIDGEIGRGDELTFTGAAKSFDYYRVKEGTRPHSDVQGTSIFDPILCEVAYRWFCPPGGTILDPFAGGSVRGVVASKLGRQYIGVELRTEQVDANRAQAVEICGAPAPVWHVGDSRDIETITPNPVDFIFSCPPYADLEVYSDDPRDISTLPYPEFRKAYSQIIAATCRLLKADRFACFVVGDVRGKDGCYYGLPWHTVEAFEAAGLRLYNESVLVTVVGSLSLRVTKQFEASRKIGKTHQNVLVFVKGDPKRAATACGEVYGDILSGN